MTTFQMGLNIPAESIVARQYGVQTAFTYAEIMTAVAACQDACNLINTASAAFMDYYTTEYPPQFVCLVDDADAIMMAELGDLPVFTLGRGREVYPIKQWSTIIKKYNRMAVKVARYKGTYATQ